MIISKENTEIIKKIVMLFKPYSNSVIVIVICIVFSSIVSLLLPLISKEIIDNGILKQDMQIVIQFSLIAFLLAVFEECLGLLEARYRAYINSMMSYTLSKDAFKQLTKLNMDFFNNKNSAEILNNINLDVSNISKVSDRSMFFIVSQIFKIIGGTIGLVLIKWELALIVLGIIPIKYIVIKHLAEKRRQLVEKYIQDNSFFYDWYGDTVNGIKEIKLYGIRRIKIGEFIKKQRDIIKTNIRLSLLDKINEMSELMLIHIIVNAIYIVGAYMIFGFQLTLGGLFAFITYSTYVTGPISAMFDIAYNFAGIIPSGKRLFDIQNMECESNNAAESRNIARLNSNSIKGDIRFENVSFAYIKNEWVLKNISFEVSSGENIAIIGPNGSGKTTIFNLLLRLYKPHKGKITLDETDINDININDYRSHISVVSQDLYLFNTSIKENISLFKSVQHCEIYKVATKSCAHEFIEAMPLQYDTMIGSNGARISGGERQKIAMARALLRDFRILLLDEATSNYDIGSESKINELLSKKNEKKTILMITHKPDILKQMDKVIMIHKGCIVDVGKHDDLYDRNLLYRDIVNREI